MKVIFLDIDGVLNSEKFYHETPAKEHSIYKFCPKAIGYLNQLTDTTGAKIVLSSSWRKNRTIGGIRELLEKNKITGEIIDKTGVLYYKNWNSSVYRGCEIQQWLDEHRGEIENYVILDDDSDMLYWQRKNYVKVDRRIGFRKKSFKKALKILANDQKS